MTTRSLALPLLAALLCGAFQGFAVSEEPEMSPQKMMELMMKYAKPGERHAELGRYIGSWTWEVRVWSMPGAPPQKSGGTAETRWIVPNTFLCTEMKGSFLGMPYQGFSIEGFDNYKKKYVGCTAHNLSTALLTYEGVVVDPTHKIQVSYGTLDEYLTGEHDKEVKYVTRLQDDDHYVLEVYDLGVGENGWKVMEFAFTRK